MAYFVGTSGLILAVLAFPSWGSSTLVIVTTATAIAACRRTDRQLKEFDRQFEEEFGPDLEGYLHAFGRPEED